MTTKIEIAKQDSEMKETEILKICRLQSFIPTEDGIELNEGYTFATNAPIPEIADGIAKMAIEIDKMKDIGEGAGAAFISLIQEYFVSNKK